ncbi:acyl-CoA synthetase [Planotetraspora silvatica]|uniref:Acyl-CoA synthetase n=1 Tax=Planotetraspora silvatica TaxID=234614 RepID=A0A8J3URX7_9ACTN|nr:AMP-binding protein [Planotetraspora silvatica]GII50243.1 acyl-CoA synthetase [Planotetraspora silvatica]
MYPGSHAVTHPDKPAIVMADSGRSLTFAQLEYAANQVGHLLRNQGLRRGDHIAVMAENRLELLVVESAAERTGLYYTLINTHLTGDEVAYIVGNCRARVFVSTVTLRDVATKAAESCPAVERFLMVGLEEPDERWESFTAAVERHPGVPVADEQRGNVMLYSSGTTGRPKGICRPLQDLRPGDADEVLDWVRDLLGFREGMTYLNPAPLYHSAPQGSVSGALRLGSTVIVMERFDAEQWCALVERHRITHCQMVPTMFIRLLRLPREVRDRYDLSSLERIVHGAAPCPVPVKQAMIEWLGPIVLEYYGATEGNGFTWCDSEQWLAHPGTVGKAIIGDVEILDDDNRPVPPGVDGTVWFRGATNFVYFDDPAKTAENRIADDRGVASTIGDIGHLDTGGYLYLTDRKSHMIISGGVNIYPQETENLLAAHPAVADVAVIGVPNPDLGEEVKAVVQLVDSAAAGPGLAAELIAYCRDRIAHYKCPRSVDFVDDLPRLPTGKLYKRLLRDRYRDTVAG